MHYEGSAPTTNYDGSGPTQGNDGRATVPAQEREENEEAEENEENEDGEEDDGVRVPDENRWMDWDNKGGCKNPKFSRKFSGFVAQVARRHVPINYTGWREFKKENERTTENMWKQIKVKS